MIVLIFTAWPFLRSWGLYLALKLEPQGGGGKEAVFTGSVGISEL